jgi:hypothetical protein
MYTYSSLRYAPLYCLIHTPLSPLSVVSAPPEGDRPSSIPEGFRETFTVVGVLGVRCGEGEGETRDGSPLKNRCFHTQGAPLPWVLICNLPLKIDNISVIAVDLSPSHPSKNGAFFLGYGFGKITSRNEKIGS